MVAALYTIGLAHLGSRLSGHDLAKANAAFVLCYGLGMVLGPQAIGIGMDLFGNDGFAWALAVFFLLYIVLGVGRLGDRGLAALDIPAPFFMCPGTFPPRGLALTIGGSDPRHSNGRTSWPKPPTSRSSCSRRPTPASST